MSISISTAKDIRDRIFIRMAGRGLPLTDHTQISALRILLEEAIVEEFASLHAGLGQAAAAWFIMDPSCRGDDLRRRLRDYKAPIPTAQPAYGMVSIVVSADTDVSPDTILRTDPTDGSPPKRYQVAVNTLPDITRGDVGDGSWHVTSARDVLVRSLSPGSIGNTSAGTITVAESTINNVVSVGNPGPIVNGQDTPSDAQLKQIFQDWLLARQGGNRTALLFGLRFARQMDGTFTPWADPATGRRVYSAAIEEWNGAQLLDVAGGAVALKVYVDEGSGSAPPGASLADPTLLAALRTRLEGDYTEANPGLCDAGIPFAVLPAIALAVPVDVTIDVARGTNARAVSAAVKEAIIGYFSRLAVSGRSSAGELRGQVSLARLFNTVEQVPGVLRVVIAQPISDVGIPIGHKAVAYDVRVTGNVVD